MHGPSVTGTGEHVPVISITRKPRPEGTTEQTRNGVGWASLALGVGSFATWGLVAPLVTIIAAVVGVILGVIGYQRAQRGEATSGTAAVFGLLVSAGVAAIFIVASAALVAQVGGL